MQAPCLSSVAANVYPLIRPSGTFSPTGEKEKDGVVPHRVSYEADTLLWPMGW